MPCTNQMLAKHLMNLLNPHLHPEGFLPPHSVALQKFLKNAFRQFLPRLTIYQLRTFQAGRKQVHRFLGQNPIPLVLEIAASVALNAQAASRKSG